MEPGDNDERRGLARDFYIKSPAASAAPRAWPTASASTEHYEDDFEDYESVRQSQSHDVSAAVRAAPEGSHANQSRPEIPETSRAAAPAGEAQEAGLMSPPAASALAPHPSESPLAPSPSSASMRLVTGSTAQRTLRFDNPMHPSPVGSRMQIDPAQLLSFGRLSEIKASLDLGTDSESEEVNKQRFFERLEARWRESGDLEPLDYSVLNQLQASASASLDASVSSPGAQLLQTLAQQLRSPAESTSGPTSGAPSQEPAERAESRRGGEQRRADEQPHAAAQVRPAASEQCSSDGPGPSHSEADTASAPERQGSSAPEGPLRTPLHGDVSSSATGGSSAPEGQLPGPAGTIHNSVTPPLGPAAAHVRAHPQAAASTDAAGQQSSDPLQQRAANGSGQDQPATASRALSSVPAAEDSARPIAAVPSTINCALAQTHADAGPAGPLAQPDACAQDPPAVQFGQPQPSSKPQGAPKGSPSRLGRPTPKAGSKGSPEHKSKLASLASSRREVHSASLAAVSKAGKARPASADPASPARQRTTPKKQAAGKPGESTKDHGKAGRLETPLRNPKTPGRPTSAPTQAGTPRSSSAGPVRGSPSKQKPTGSGAATGSAGTTAVATAQLAVPSPLRGPSGAAAPAAEATTSGRTGTGTTIGAQHAQRSTDRLPGQAASPQRAQHVTAGEGPGTPQAAKQGSLASLNGLGSSVINQVMSVTNTPASAGREGASASPSLSPRPGSARAARPPHGPLSLSQEDLNSKFLELQQQMQGLPLGGEARNQQRAGAHREAELQKQLDALRAKLLAETEARHAAGQKLAEQKREQERAEKRLREHYEARLREKQKELSSTRARLQEVEGEEPRAKVLAADTEVVLTGSELAALRREITEQEVLLKGYQAENEAAVERMREMAAEARRAEEQVAKEHAHMERTLARMQEQSQHAHAETGGKLAAVLQLEAALEAARQDATSREAELRAEMERLRREKKEAEARAGGLNLPQMEAEDSVVKRMAADKEAQLQQIRGEMQGMMQRHAEMAAQMEAKLQWYAENQDLVNQNSELIRQQAETIAQMEQQLVQYESAGSKPGATARKRIKELEAEVQALKDALTQRHPNSIPALIAAAKPSLEDSALVADLRSKLQRLQAALVLKDEEMENELRALRQEQERLKRQFQGHNALSENGANKEGRSARAKELEKQLEEVRAMYTRKLRAAEAKLQDVLKAQRESAAEPKAAAPSKDAPPAHIQQLKLREQKIKHLEGDLAFKDGVVRELEKRLHALEQDLKAARRNADAPAASGPSPTSADDEEAIAALQQVAEELASENDALRAQLEAVTAHQSQQAPAELAKLREEADSLRQRLAAAEMAMQTVQRAHTEAVERSTLLQADHQRQMSRLYEEHAGRVGEVAKRAAADESVRWRERVEAAEKARGEAAQQAALLQEQLRSARANVPWSPKAAEFAALERKILDMEAAEAQRAAQWGSLLEERRWLAAALPAPEPSGYPHDPALDMQSAEIERLRRELDAILTSATVLQQQQQQQQHLQPGVMQEPQAQGPAYPAS